MADVTIHDAVSADTRRGMRSIAYLADDDQVGYDFYINSAWDFFYRKTSDGGASWDTPVTLFTGTVLLYDIWADWWTPGDTGTLIHFWYSDTGSDDVKWRTLDTADDTLGTERVVFAAGSIASGRGQFVSGCKSRSGYLYCAFDVDAGAERGLHRSTDGGTTWGSDLDDTFVEATIDQCLLFPASGTGDNNDIWALYHDADADALTLKLWDSSAGSAVESATIMSLVENTTDFTGQYGFSGALFSDGDLFATGISAFDSASGVHRCFRIGGTSDIVELTAIATTDDHYYPAVFIDQTTDDIYVAYSGKIDGSEALLATTTINYVKSSDGGTTWDDEVQYSEAAADDNRGVWTPLSGPRFYVAWCNDDLRDIFGNAVNSLTFAGGPPAVSGSGSEAMALSLAGSGQQGHSGSGSAGMAFALAAAGLVLAPVTGSGGLAMSMGLAGSGQQGHTGTGSVAMAPALAGSGALSFTGTGGLTFTLGLSGEGQQSHTGTGDLGVALSLDGSGSVSGAPEAVSGSGGLGVDLSLAGTGQQKHTGTGSLALALSLDGSGSVAGAPEPVTGTGDIGSGIMFGLSGSGTVEYIGTMSPGGAGSGTLFTSRHKRFKRPKWEERKERPVEVAPEPEKPAPRRPKIGKPTVLPVREAVLPALPPAPIHPEVQDVDRLLNLPLMPMPVAHPIEEPEPDYSAAFEAAIQEAARVEAARVEAERIRAEQEADDEEAVEALLKWWNK